LQKGVKWRESVAAAAAVMELRKMLLGDVGVVVVADAFAVEVK
jgi:hypothetical protein